MATILVVDDSPTVGCTVEWVLRDHGHTVHGVNDGLSAVNALNTIDPDLLLLDIRLPHIDGVQLCKMIRSNARYDTLPIVMLSGLSKETDIQRAFDAGADDYITKPISDQRLISVVMEQLAQAEKI